MELYKMGNRFSGIGNTEKSEHYWLSPVRFNGAGKIKVKRNKVISKQAFALSIAKDLIKYVKRLLFCDTSNLKK